MRIGNDCLQSEAWYGNTRNKNTVGSFSDTMKKIEEDLGNKNSARDAYVNYKTYSSSEIYSKNEICQDVKLPIETERYKISDASDVLGVPAYEIKDKLSEQRFYMREDQLAIQRDAKTGMEFLMAPDQQLLPNHILVTDELKSILSGLAEKRNIEIKEMPLQGGIVVNQDPKTGLKYLTIKGNEAKAVSLIYISEEDKETFEKLVDEFQTYECWSSSSRSVAGIFALLEISGNLKREKEGFTYLTPDGISYYPYAANDNRVWILSMPESCYAAARQYLATGKDCTVINTWTRILKGATVYYDGISATNSDQKENLERWFSSHKMNFENGVLGNMI